MRISRIVFASTAVVLSGCSTTPKQNDQQAFEAELSETSLFLKTLHTLDSSDTGKTRQVAMIPVFVNISSLPGYAAKGHPTPEQRQELINVARDTLEYLSTHRLEFANRLPSVQMCLRGLRTVLTEPDDARRVRELSDYFYQAEKETHMP